MGANGLIKLAAKSGAFLKTHKATICMCAGIVSGVGAVVECGHATVKSYKQVEQKNTERSLNGDDALTKKEVIQLCWKNYLLTAGLTFAAIGTTAYGYGVTLKQLGVATAGAKAAEMECKQLKDTIDEVLGDEDHKDIKDKVINRFTEKKAEVYADGNQPIDVFRPPLNVHGGRRNAVERYRDEKGFEFTATWADVLYAVSELHNTMKDSMSYETLDSFYRLITDDVPATNIGDQFRWEYDSIRDVNDIDVRRTPSYDVDGLIWELSYTIPPTYCGQ